MTAFFDKSIDEILSYLSSDTSLASLVKRLELSRPLLRRYHEHLLVALFDFDDDFIQSESKKLLSDISLERFLTQKDGQVDFKYHIASSCSPTFR